MLMTRWIASEMEHFSYSIFLNNDIVIPGIKVISILPIQHNWFYYLQIMHHRPQSISEVPSGLVNFTVMVSKNMVSRSFVFHFFVLRSTGDENAKSSAPVVVLYWFISSLFHILDRNCYHIITLVFLKAGLCCNIPMLGDTFKLKIQTHVNCFFNGAYAIMPCMLYLLVGSAVALFGAWLTIWFRTAQWICLCSLMLSPMTVGLVLRRTWTRIFSLQLGGLPTLLCGNTLSWRLVSVRHSDSVVESSLEEEHAFFFAAWIWFYTSRHFFFDIMLHSERNNWSGLVASSLRPVFEKTDPNWPQDWVQPSATSLPQSGPVWTILTWVDDWSWSSLFQKRKKTRPDQTLKH